MIIPKMQDEMRLQNNRYQENEKADYSFPLKEAQFQPREPISGLPFLDNRQSID